MVPTGDKTAPNTAQTVGEAPAATLLVIGGPDTGKTHFGAQLLARLNRQRGRLHMRSAPWNVVPFESTLLRLSQGMTAGHTPTEQYAEVTLPVADTAGGAIDLVWPDYGGEQIDNLLCYRQVPAGWRQRLLASDGWILFVRLQHVHIEQDLLSRPPGEAVPLATETAPQGFRWSDQARLVDLLQLLLFVKGVGTIDRLRSPALTVLLSCWDEITGLSADLAPAQLLAERMPMLSSFVETNWMHECLSVIGLSSLGKVLREDTPDEEYLDAGPEAFGYVVLPRGERSSDLTLPVAELAARAR